MLKLSKWEEIKCVLSLKRISFTVAIVSIVYGIQLIIYPQILQQYEVYKLIHELFRTSWIGGVFVFLGLLKLYGLIVNSHVAKITSKTLLAFMYMLFTVAFKISPPPNTVWIFSLTMLCLTGMTTLRFYK